MQVSTHYKDIFKLAGPIVLSLLIPQLNFFTNTVFLGVAVEGEQYLAVMAISGIFYLTLSMIGYGLANGIQIQLSRRAGEGDETGISRLMGNGVLLTLFLSLCLMTLSLWLAPLIFGLSLSSASRTVMSLQFLYIRIWGLPFLMLTQLANAFWISISKSRNLMIASGTSTGINILLDYLFIAGRHGFPAMGLLGAAWASIAAEIGGFVSAWSIYFLQQYHKRFALQRYLRLDLPLAKRMLQISSPLIVQYFFSIGGWQVFFIFVEHLGQAELAASQVLRSIYGIIGIFTWAFAATTASMVSNIIAQNRHEEVFGLVWKIAKASFLITLGMCMLLLVFAWPFLAAYRDDPALITLAMPSLRVIVVAALVMSVSTVVFNAVVGTGNTMINLTIEITCVACYLVYCYVVIERMRSDLVWAWCSEFVYWSSLLIICFLYLRSGRWKGKMI